MSKTHDKLKALSQGKVSNWQEEARLRKKNRKWLHYSSHIARRLLAAIEDVNGMNQKKLAEQIDVSPQYISKIVKGGENLSLETIAKLSEALGVELISFPEYKYSQLIGTSKYFVPKEITVSEAKISDEHPFVKRKFEKMEADNSKYAMSA